MDVIAAVLHQSVVFRRPIEEQEFRRHREGLELRLEAGEDHPKDREEDDEADQPGGCRADNGMGGRDSPRHGQVSRFLPMRRTRKMATILASTTATRPPADAPPTSYWMRAWE